MAELELISKQPRSHAYKRDTIERVDIPNCLNQSTQSPGLVDHVEGVIAENVRHHSVGSQINLPVADMVCCTTRRECRENLKELRQKRHPFGAEALKVKTRRQLLSEKGREGWKGPTLWETNNSPQR